MKKNTTKKHVISFRLTDEQHAVLKEKCLNAQGELVIKPASLAKASTLDARPIPYGDDALERYRLSVAAVISSAFDDLVSQMRKSKDYGLMDADDYKRLEERLDFLQSQVSNLLAPLQLVAQTGEI